MNASATDLVRERTRRQPNAMAAFGVLAVVQFVLIAAITVLSVALPSIQHDLRLTTGDLALASAAYGLSFSGLLLLGGRLADQFGQRRVFAVGLAFFCLASALVGLATGLWPLLAARFAQGMGAALAAPSAMALLGSVFPDRARRERMTAVWGTVAAMGATGGTLLSGVVVSLTSWRWAFLSLVVVAAIALIGTFRVVPVGPSPTRTTLDLPGAALVTLGLTALSYGLVVSTGRSWSSPGVAGPLVCGVALLVLFVVAEAVASAPLVPLAFFASGRRLVALSAVLLGSATMSTVFFFLALYFQQVRGYSPLLTSAAFIPFGVVLLLTGLASGKVVARIGAGATVATGLGLAAVGLLLLSRLGLYSPYAGLLLIGLVVFPVGATLTFSGATVAAVADVPPGDAGLAGGVVNTALEVGPTVGFAVLVSLAGGHTLAEAANGASTTLATTAGYGYALGVAGAAAAVAALLTLTALVWRTRTSNATSTTSRREMP